MTTADSAADRHRAYPEIRDDVRKCLRLLTPAARRRWYGLVPLAVMGAAVEAFGAAGVFGLLTILNNPERARTLPLMSWVYPHLSSPDPRSIIVALTLLLIAFYVVRYALLIATAYIHERVVQQAVVDVTRRLLLHYLEAPYPFFFQRNSAILLSRVKDMVESAYVMVLSSAVHIVGECLIVIGLVGVLAATVPPGTILAVALTGLLLLVPAALSSRFFAKWGRAVKAIDLELRQGLQQSLAAIKDVKIAGRERFFYERLAQAREALSRVLHRRAVTMEALRLMVETIFVTALLVVVLILVLSGRPGGEAVSLLGLFAYAGFRLVPSANRVTMYLNTMRGGGPFIRDVYADFVVLDAVVRPAATNEGESGPRFSDVVVFDRVSFGYDDREVVALDDVSMTIRKGESIGIVGHTGAGKSTFVDLLLGLLQPTAGRITIDGRDLALNVRWWQRQLGYVPQVFSLIDDSLRRNIAFGLADADIDEERVAAVVRMAQLQDVVSALPEGLDTYVGERGIRLSGGQRQRVAIARALYRNPQVVIFDEATSSLDSQTELEITRAIESLHRTVTLVVIAHRLSTVRACDRLVFLQGGRIVAVGTFEELLARDPDFRAMATAGA